MNITWSGRNGYGEGRSEWHDAPSLQAREKQAIAEAQAAGLDIDRAPR